MIVITLSTITLNIGSNVQQNLKTNFALAVAEMCSFDRVYDAHCASGIYYLTILSIH